MTLNQLIDNLEQRLGNFDKVNSKISARGVDWHIDHSLKVVIEIIVSLKKSNPTEYKWKFSLLRSYILLFGIIPKGKGKSPKIVNNINTIDLNEVLAQIKETKKLILEINSLTKNNHFDHPYFGLLKLSSTQRFLKIHTKHHLKIINDIIEK